MNFSFLLQFVLHGLCEWLVSFAIAFWISQGWQLSPTPILVRLVRNPLRIWVMVAFGVAPPTLSLLLNPLLIQLYTSEGSSMARIPISYLLSAIYGVLVGVAASCATAPATIQQPMRARPAAGVSAVLIVASYLLGSLLRFQLAVHTIGEIAVALIVLFIARSMIGTEASAQAELAVPPPISRHLTPALVIGFVPAALILAAIAIGSSVALAAEAINTLLVLGCIVSIVCCFTASIMLFKRHTGGAVAGGILLLLLNAFIAFFFGCCAAISNTSFR